MKINIQALFLAQKSVYIILFTAYFYTDFYVFPFYLRKVFLKIEFTVFFLAKKFTYSSRFIVEKKHFMCYNEEKWRSVFPYWLLQCGKPVVKTEYLNVFGLSFARLISTENFTETVYRVSRLFFQSGFMLNL